jgi:hypothetical protein
VGDADSLLGAPARLKQCTFARLPGHAHLGASREQSARHHASTVSAGDYCVRRGPRSKLSTK